MERSQYTFYESFYKAISRIRKDADRAKAYDVITRFALYGEEPDVEHMPDNVAIAFEVIRPNIEASRRKAESGRKGGGSKPEANDKQTQANRKQNEANGKQTQANAKQNEANRKQEKEQEKEQDKDKEQMLPPIVPQGTFERFWQAYPKKVGKEAAYKAFMKIRGVSVETMLKAIETQRRSDQWRNDNGRFIPNPATWLNQGRWEDELVQTERKAQAVPADYGQNGPVDRGDIDWLLREGMV